MRNWRKNGRCIVLFFGSKKGEITVTISAPEEENLLEYVHREAEHLRKTYVSRNGTKLGKFHHARLITRAGDAIPGIPKPQKRR